MSRIEPRDWATHDWAEPDALLCMSVAGGLDDAVEVPVTLLVHGQAISGVVISGPRWCAEQIEMAFPGTDPAENEGLLGGMYRTFRERADAREAAVARVRKQDEDAEISEEDSAAVNGLSPFLHLRDPMLVVPGAAPVKYAYMRVRLASIDAWTFGQTEVKTDEG